jgi:hypothetical protein
MKDFDFPRMSDHELVFFFYPSPGLDWSSPRGLTVTTALNKLLGRPRGIGHVSVMVRSGEREVLTGMTQSKKGEGRREVLLDGYGMGILFHDFSGTLEEAEKLAPELVRRSRREGSLSYLRVAVNAGIATRLLAYVEEFRARGYDRVYGGMRNRPLHGEGAGCSIFAASFLELAGLMHEEYERSWVRRFNLPHHLIGGPKAGRKVSLLALGTAGRWAEEHEPHEKGFFWDPDLMHDWLERRYREIKSGSVAEGALRFEPETWNLARGLRYDASSAPVPTGRIFQHLE